MSQEIDRVNNIMANNIIKDSGIIAYLIKKYFRENHNIDLGDFQNKQFVSKEVAALDVSKSVIINKYSFFCSFDYNNAKSVYIDVYIRYIGFEDGSIDASVPVIIDRFVTEYINHEDDSIENCAIKKFDMFSPLKEDGIRKQSSTFEYSVYAELDLSINMKFVKKEDNK